MGEALITRRGSGSNSVDPKVIATKSAHWDGTAQNIQIVLPKKISEYRSLIITMTYSITSIPASVLSGSYVMYIGNQSFRMGDFTYGSMDKTYHTTSGVLKRTFMPVAIKPDLTTCSLSWSGSTSGLTQQALDSAVFDALDNNYFEFRTGSGGNYYGDYTWTIYGC